MKRKVLGICTAFVLVLGLQSVSYAGGPWIDIDNIPSYLSQVNKTKQEYVILGTKRKDLVAKIKTMMEKYKAATDKMKTAEFKALSVNDRGNLITVFNNGVTDAKLAISHNISSAQAFSDSIWYLTQAPFRNSYASATSYLSTCETHVKATFNDAVDGLADADEAIEKFEEVVENIPNP